MQVIDKQTFQSLVFVSFVLLLVMNTQLSQAQVYVNLSDVKIESGTEVFIGDAVGDDLVVSSNGRISNDGLIRFATDATLLENSNQAGNGIVAGAGDLRISANLNALNQVNVGGLGLELTSAADLGVTEIIRHHTPYENNGNQTINRSYELIPTNNSNLDATIVFHYDETELNGYDELSLQMVEKHNQWQPLASTVDAANNNITYAGLDSLKIIAVQNSELSLPIELAYFRASVEYDMVYLSWETISETNNDYFTIERSYDGVHFQPIHETPGAGNSTTSLRYHYTDQYPLTKVLYYRLKQTDFDGKFSYSSVEKVEMNRAAAIAAYPNPSTDYLFIGIGSDAKAGAIKMYNSSGSEVALPKIEYANETRLDVSRLSAGVYMLRIEPINFTSRVIVSH